MKHTEDYTQKRIVIPTNVTLDPFMEISKSVTERKKAKILRQAPHDAPSVLVTKLLLGNASTREAPASPACPRSVIFAHQNLQCCRCLRMSDQWDRRHWSRSRALPRHTFSLASVVMYAIAAVSRNGIIGSEGKIPWHLPLDFKWFKHKTLGGILFMGRKTYESIGKPLPGRTTYVITRLAQLKGLPPEVQVSNDWKADEVSLEYTGKTIWVCGGGEIYRELLPHCSRLYLTRVKQDVEGDARFPAMPESFYCDQLIHENDAFSVERWLNSANSGILTPKEEWPFAGAGSIGSNRKD